MCYKAFVSAMLAYKAKSKSKGQMCITPLFYRANFYWFQRKTIPIAFRVKVWPKLTHNKMTKISVLPMIESIQK